jgi:DNA-binding FadR family transcriptional regulator
MEILSHSREESLQTKDRRKASIESHRKILTAIADHDQKKAREAMLKHIESVEDNVLSAKKPPYTDGPLDERRIS